MPIVGSTLIFPQQNSGYLVLLNFYYYHTLWEEKSWKPELIRGSLNASARILTYL